MQHHPKGSRANGDADCDLKSTRWQRQRNRDACAHAGKENLEPNVKGRHAQAAKSSSAAICAQELVSAQLAIAVLSQREEALCAAERKLAERERAHAVREQELFQNELKLLHRQQAQEQREHDSQARADVFESRLRELRVDVMQTEKRIAERAKWVAQEQLRMAREERSLAQLRRTFSAVEARRSRPVSASSVALSPSHGSTSRPAVSAHGATNSFGFQSNSRRAAQSATELMRADVLFSPPRFSSRDQRPADNRANHTLGSNAALDSRRILMTPEFSGGPKLFMLDSCAEDDEEDFRIEAEYDTDWRCSLPSMEASFEVPELSFTDASQCTSSYEALACAAEKTP